MHPNGRRGMIGVEVDFLDEPVSEARLRSSRLPSGGAHAAESRGTVDTILLPKGIATAARMPANAGCMPWWAVVHLHSSRIMKVVHVQALQAGKHCDKYGKREKVGWGGDFS